MPTIVASVLVYVSAVIIANLYARILFKNHYDRIKSCPKDGELVRCRACNQEVRLKICPHQKSWTDYISYVLWVKPPKYEVVELEKHPNINPVNLFRMTPQGLENYKFDCLNSSGVNWKWPQLFSKIE